MLEKVAPASLVTTHLPNRFPDHRLSSIAICGPVARIVNFIDDG